MKAILWDLDGTLLDTLDDLTDSVNFALEQGGLAPRARAEVRSFIGGGIRNLMARAVLDGEGNPAFEVVFAAFHAHYAHNSANKTRPYPGVDALLEALKAQNCRMAIVSNKAEFAVQTLAKAFFPQIGIAVGEREDMAKKPAPDGVFAALAALGAAPEDALYIGDSEVDVQTAANAGVICVCVSWGFRDRTLLEQAGAKYIVQDVAELRSLLETLCG